MAQEYFVNEPEYREIMRILTELGGVDLDELLQRMTALENEVDNLSTRLGNTEDNMTTITGNITNINNNITGISEAETARNEWHDLLAWGNYHTANQTLNLTGSISNYDFLCVIAGYSSTTNNSGYGTLYLPVSLISTGTVFTVRYDINNVKQSVVAQFSDATHLKILSASENNLGIRMIRGKKK